MSYRVAMLAGLAILCSPAMSAAAANDETCNLRIEPATAQWRLDDVNIFDSDVVHGSFDVQLVNEGDVPCQLQFDVDLRGAAFGLTTTGGKRVSYAISDVGAGRDLTPRNGRSNASGRRVIVVPPKSTSLQRLDVVVDPNFQTDGSYAQSLFLQALKPNSNEILAEKAVTLVVQAPPTATLGLSGNFTRIGGMADVDLGNLEELDRSPSVVMHIKSSRAYKIRASSENGGRLMKSGTNWGIPYRISFDGVSLNPANGVYLSPPGAERRVDNMKLGFDLAGSTDVAAGRYSDVLTLEISVN